MSSEFSSAADPSNDFPVYLTTLPNPNDYTLFANSGWDGNWFAGYTNGWIKKLPPVPPGRYARAYVGARLGRMKTTGPVGRPPEFPPVPGGLYMAVSSTSAWRADDVVELVSAKEIPLEGQAEYAIEGTGESQWFWAEVPLTRLSPTGDNYVVLFASSPQWASISSSPVLAAGWGGKEIDTWLRNDLKGRPPTTATDSPGTGISYFQPAIGLKLIPAGAPHPMAVRLIAWKDGTPERPKPIITASVSGESIERVWVEVESDKRWKKVGRTLWKAPYIFTLDPKELPRGKVRLRVAAANIWEETSTSQAVRIEVGEVKKK